jgi:hypothetical protein
MKIESVVFTYKFINNSSGEDISDEVQENTPVESLKGDITDVRSAKAAFEPQANADLYNAVVLIISVIPVYQGIGKLITKK